MKVGELQRREAAAFEQRDSERIADRGLHQRGGGRRQNVRTGFAHLRQLQHDPCGLAQRGRCTRSHRNHGNRKAGRIIDQVLHVGLLAGPRQRDDNVVGRDHAEITMAGLGGVHEKRGGAGGGKRGSDLARHMA